MFLKEVALKTGKLLCEVLVLILIYIFHILILLHLCVIIWYIYYEILQYLFIMWNFMKLLHGTWWLQVNICLKMYSCLNYMIL